MAQLCVRFVTGLYPYLLGNAANYEVMVTGVRAPVYTGTAVFIDISGTNGKPIVRYIAVVYLG